MPTTPMPTGQQCTDGTKNGQETDEDCGNLNPNLNLNLNPNSNPTP